MSTAKEKISDIIKKQPDDATYDEIMRELAFEQMIERGLKDSSEDRVFQMNKLNIASIHGRNKMDRSLSTNYFIVFLLLFQ